MSHDGFSQSGLGSIPAELLRKLVRNAVNRQAADLVERVEDGTLVRWRVRE